MLPPVDDAVVAVDVVEAGAATGITVIGVVATTDDVVGNDCPIVPDACGVAIALFVTATVAAGELAVLLLVANWLSGNGPIFSTCNSITFMPGCQFAVK